MYAFPLGRDLFFDKANVRRWMGRAARPGQDYRQLVQQAGHAFDVESMLGCFEETDEPFSWVWTAAKDALAEVVS